MTDLKQRTRYHSSDGEYHQMLAHFPILVLASHMLTNILKTSIRSLTSSTERSSIDSKRSQTRNKETAKLRMPRSSPSDRRKRTWRRPPPLRLSCQQRRTSSENMRMRMLYSNTFTSLLWVSLGSVTSVLH